MSLMIYVCFFLRSLCSLLPTHMIHVYFFLRSLCSLLPTHINFSWSRRFIQKCLKIARGCFSLPLFANPRIVLNFIPDLYPVVLNCFCLLFFIMVVTSAISIKLIVFWKLYPSCPFTMFTLFCRSHFIWLLSRSWSTNLLKGLHHYYTLHRLSIQIEVPSRGFISKKKLVCLYKFGMIFFRRMFSTTYLKMR